ncbi:MAG: TolC family protein [Pirellulales bacterium]|nr:TolC family protein [Pirellulales bacterium]
MRRQSPLPFAVIAAAFVLLAGCQPQEPFFLRGAKDPTLTHYKAVGTEIEYPDVYSETLADVKGAIEPFSLGRKQPKDFWDIKLEEVVRITLENNKIIRSLGGQVSPQAPIDNILRSPDAISSIYDPALVETNPRSGVEAALSAFDTQFATNLFWQKLDTPQNSTGIIDSRVLRGDNANFVAQLQKISATGGTSTIRHNVQYGLSNQPFRVFPSDWNVNLEIEARQPLLRGSGVQYNRIAGPGAQPGQYNGVMLARLNTDIALADFEAAVRNLVADTEAAYWELYYYYRSLDAVSAGRDRARKTWQQFDVLRQLGGETGDAAAETQARTQYYIFRNSTEQTLSLLYEAEAKLRYLMGIASTDGRLIRPAEEPTTAKVTFDWYEISSEALVRNVELRRIKFGVQRRELELIASKNFLLPQMDVDALYRWRGLGNDLLNSSPQPGNFLSPGSNAYQTLTSGDFQEWQVGLVFQMPIGFRRENSGVRNAQLSLTKERAVLQEAELELSHVLATAWRTLENDYQLSNTNFQRRIAAQRNVEANEAVKDTKNFRIEVLLQAQRELAQAESDYYRSLVNYNKDIMFVHLRKGSLLEYNGVYLAEGPWPGKAYFDARRRARARDAALYIDYGFTQPRVVSQGPYQQFADEPSPIVEEGEAPRDAGKPSPFIEEPVAPRPESVPAPAPEPGDPGYNRKEAPPEPPIPPEPVIPTAFAPAKSKAAERGVIGRSQPASRKAFDIGALQLSELEEHPIRRTSAVQPAQGQGAAAQVPQKSSRLQWTDAKQRPTHELNAHPSTAEPDRPAAGWQGIQR